MKVTLDSGTIQAMSFFQNMTGSSVVDCITDGDEIYFVVAHGQYGLSVGRQGAKIKGAERLFKKSIKIFEYSPDLKEFVKNLIPETQEAEINGKNIQVKIRQSDRAKVIGKGGRNIKIINKFLKRLFDIDSLKVK
ncbi:MAG: NusA-like transcription termination signal-binding factor [Candidatus Aenigmarchaeota archaeon]|nr:NusA-like transcription termination signal-binding factor [Candidatus Aenigmarchaeota archaeon]